MTLNTVRSICRAFPEVTEDVKWGHDLCFSVREKMFTVVNLEPPHQIAFKCTPESFAELVERPGIVPAPYMARNMWVMEQELGESLDRRELAALVKTSYDLVVAKLPKSKRAAADPRSDPGTDWGRAERRERDELSVAGTDLASLTTWPKRSLPIKHPSRGRTERFTKTGPSATTCGVAGGKPGSSSCQWQEDHLFTRQEKRHSPTEWTPSTGLPG